MKNNRWYPYLVTFVIMAVFFSISYFALPDFEFNQLEQATQQLVPILIGLQLILALGIVALMKYDGSYQVLSQPGFQLSQLFRPALAWVFIWFKVIVIGGMVLVTPQEYRDQFLNFNPLNIGMAVLLAFSVGIFEEYLFRGFLFKHLYQGQGERGVYRAALVSSLLFGLFHLDFLAAFQGQLPANIGGAVFAFGVGYYFAALTYRFGKLWVPIVLHALIDLPTFILVGIVRLDNIMELLEQLLEGSQLSIADMVDGGSNPAIIIIGIAFYLAGLRMLRRSVGLREREIAYEVALARRIEEQTTAHYMPNIEDFQPKALREQASGDSSRYERDYEED